MAEHGLALLDFIADKNKYEKYNRYMQQQQQKSTDKLPTTSPFIAPSNQQEIHNPDKFLNPKSRSLKSLQQQQQEQQTLSSSVRQKKGLKKQKNKMKKQHNTKTPSHTPQSSNQSSGGGHDPDSNEEDERENQPEEEEEDNEEEEEEEGKGEDDDNENEKDSGEEEEEEDGKENDGTTNEVSKNITMNDNKQPTGASSSQQQQTKPQLAKKKISKQDLLFLSKESTMTPLPNKPVLKKLHIVSPQRSKQPPFIPITIQQPLEQKQQQQQQQQPLLKNNNNIFQSLPLFPEGVIRDNNNNNNNGDALRQLTMYQEQERKREHLKVEKLTDDVKELKLQVSQVLHMMEEFLKNSNRNDNNNCNNHETNNKPNGNNGNNNNNNNNNNKESNDNTYQSIQDQEDWELALDLMALQDGAATAKFWPKELKIQNLAPWQKDALVRRIDRNIDSEMAASVFKNRINLGSTAIETVLDKSKLLGLAWKGTISSKFKEALDKGAFDLHIRKYKEYRQRSPANPLVDMGTLALEIILGVFQENGVDLAARAGDYIADLTGKNKDLPPPPAPPNIPTVAATTTGSNVTTTRPPIMATSPPATTSQLHNNVSSIQPIQPLTPPVTTTTAEPLPVKQYRGINRGGSAIPLQGVGIQQQQGTANLMKDALPMLTNFMAGQQASTIVDQSRERMIMDRLKCASRVVEYNKQKKEQIQIPSVADLSKNE